MATLEAYLILAGFPLQVLGTFLGVIMFLSGAIVLFRSRHTALIVRGVAGAWYFGSLTYSLGMVSMQFAGPTNPLQAVWAVVGCTIAFGIIGLVVSALIATIGDFAIGLAAGWSIWAIIAGMIPSHVANLVIGFALSLVGGAAVRIQPLRFGEIAVCWLGSTLLTLGLVGIIINSMLILSSAGDAVQSAFFITYILAIVFSITLFALTLRLQSASILGSSEKGFENTTHA